MEKLELFYPIRPWFVSQKFGDCHPAVCDFYKNVLKMRGHNGLDVRASRGQKVYAAHDGVVTFAGEDGSAGYGVVIRTLDKREYGIDGAYFKTIYWHLLANGISVRAGQNVKVGDVIGLADSTGVSSGDHLHFGLKPMKPGEQDWQWFNLEQTNGYMGAIDPFSYFNDVYADEAQTLLSRLSQLILLLQRMVDSLR